MNGHPGSPVTWPQLTVLAVLVASLLLTPVWGMIPTLAVWQVLEIAAVVTIIRRWRARRRR